ncbi:MAG: hypothetical protein ACI4HO_00175 [Ruminococcus sp.]
MAHNELDFLYDTVAAASTNSNPYMNSINSIETKLEEIILELAHNDHSDFKELDFDEIKTVIYDMCDLYAKDAFAKGIAFANNLNKQVDVHRNKNIQD